MASSYEEAAKLSAPGEKLYMSHVFTGNRDDIYKAVRCAQAVFFYFCARAVIHQTPPSDTAMLIIQYNLGRALFRRFLATRQAEDMQVGVEMFRRASHCNGRGTSKHFYSQWETDDVRYRCFQYLIVYRFIRDDNLDRFLQLDAPDELSKLLRPSLEVKILTHDLERGDVLRYLDETLFKSGATFQPNVEDLDSKIELCRKALQFFKFSPNPVACSKIVFHLGILLHFRLSRHVKLEDNNEAISCFCSALRMQLPLRLVGPCLVMACNAFIQRYEVLRWQEDLHNAYTYVKQAMKIFDAFDNVKRSMGMESRDVGVLHCLDNLARVMRWRYRATGDLEDLNSAIDASSRVVDVAEDSDSDIDLPRFLNNLAESLKFRVQRTGHTEDMRLAIEKLQSAVALWPPNHPGRIQSLVQLSWFEGMQDQKLSGEGYAERAVQHFQQAFSMIEQSTGLQHESEMSSLEGMMTTVLSVFPNMKWSEEMEARARETVSSDSAYNPRAKFSYAVLYSLHIGRWRDTHEIKEINEAISIARSVIKGARRSPDELISARVDLGQCLFERYRYESTNDSGSCKEAVKVLLKGFQSSTGAPYHRMRAGKVAIDILSELTDWGRASQLCREMVDLLVILNGRSLDWQDKQFWLRQFSSQAALYASIALQAGSDAWDVIDMLETCRGSILGHVIDNRTDLDDLKKAAPEKAERFRTLQDEINAVIDSPGNVSSSVHVEQVARRIRADREIRALLDEIRKQKDFRRFLLGPSQDEVIAAAAQGPIVIVNISPIRSDAIIITKKNDCLLPLPKVKYQKAKDYLDADLSNFDMADMGRKNKRFRELQRWLWENCVELILDKLQDLVGSSAKLQVWWIGIGIANSLPFHAAGIYTASQGPETALSRVISSYTPTLKILIHGRRRTTYHCPKPITPGLTKMAIIIMPSTPGMVSLEGVEKESEAVVNIVSSTYSPSVISQPSADTAKKLMRECEIMHFACHGESILEDPSSSHLLLQATIPNFSLAVDKLKVRDVAITHVSGKLVFLSACSTAESKLTTLWDEVLHLASGFQVAGFSHAIGNLWMASDEISVHLVQRFYQYLLDAGELGEGENVAMALNKALMEIAKNNAKDPLSWAQYVHFGI